VFEAQHFLGKDKHMKKLNTKSKLLALAAVACIGMATI
jgi:hypothetical protein